MFKGWFLAIILIVFAANVHGQGQWLTGYLRDSITHFPITGNVTNTTSKQRVRTDGNGFFRLRVNAGDLIYLVAPSYRYDTLRYSPLFMDTVNVYLSPTGSVLPMVTVTSKYTKYQLDSAERRREFDENKGTSLNAVASQTSGLGLTLNLDRFFKKKYRDKQKAERLFRKNEERAYVEYRFSPSLVASYTGLKGEALRQFMYRYTPDYEWLRKHPSNEDMLYYLNEKLKEYRIGVLKGQQAGRF